MTYHLAYISETKPIVSDTHVSELLNINNLEDAEKILAAEFYTLGAKNVNNVLKIKTTQVTFENNIKMNWKK